MDAFLTMLSRTITAGRLIPRRAPILLAVSGGRDSMTLLAALHALRPEFKWRLTVAHFNHQLRGRVADGDQRFVKRVCASLDIPCHIARWNRAARDRAVKQHGVERAAREARLAFLKQTARRTGSRNVILAHHADDQVELLFVRLFRGAGSRGLAGMRARVRSAGPGPVWLVRPFLEFTRKEISDWATRNGIEFRDDTSNDNPRFIRNRIRNEFLPFVQRTFPETNPAVIRRTMELLADESDWIRREAAACLRLPRDQRTAFAEIPVALQRQIIVLQLEKHGLPFDGEVVERLRREAGTKISTPGNHLLSRDAAGELTAHDSSEGVSQNGLLRVELGEDRGTVQFDGLVLNWARASLKRRPAFRADRELFDAAVVGQSIVLRHWRAGDRFQPIGMNRPVKLQDLFTNAKVPRAERGHRTVATTVDGEIFWVEGLRIGEPFKLTPATRTCLTWSWSRNPVDGR